MSWHDGKIHVSQYTKVNYIPICQQWAVEILMLKNVIYNSIKNKGIFRYKSNKIYKESICWIQKIEEINQRRPK